MADYLESVRRQYEDYPYPNRDPRAEKTSIQVTFMDSLGWINHYCYRGKQSFANSFRVLVAGGGTGDATIFLAEQLRDTDARIIHLDISEASIEIAMQRAQVRGLDNVEFFHGSILDLPNSGLDAFDYINCSGVLHHLQDPTTGLKALRSVLTDDGAMGIMVYGKYGRTGVYQMQELMRLINGDSLSLQEQLQNTNVILDCLPETNWFRMMEKVFFPDSANRGDYEVVDTFLHSRDRAYTVCELYEWLQNCGLNLAAFAESRIRYQPQLYIKDEALLANIRRLPVSKQQAIAELIVGNIRKHTFYASPNTNTAADPHDLDNVPCFHELTPAEKFYRMTEHNTPGTPVTLNLFDDSSVSFVPGGFAGYFFKYIDGNRTTGECIGMVRAESDFSHKPPRTEDIKREFIRLYELLNMTGLLVLRHKSVKPFKTFEKLRIPVK